MAENRKIAIICGPTGSGKSSVAESLVGRFPIEIISADSRQIFKHLDIGTAKPTKSERERVPTHLIDLIELGERYSAFRFIGDATDAIAKTIARNRIPVVVGGSGLYLQALTDGVVEVPNDDESMREKLEVELQEHGANALHEKLVDVDPVEAAKIHPNNGIRILRALEIYFLTGKRKSELIDSGAYRKTDYSFEQFGLIPDRGALYDGINARVDRMFSGGLEAEFDRLIEAGKAEELRRSNVIGYAELLSKHDGLWSHEKTIEMIKQNTRRYAKRQLTWFRARSDIIQCDSIATLTEQLSAWLERVWCEKA
ncbi:MAG: tRNA (adenosine(37)-N6)-dimethylallyltransferase MiaA [candidate division Zixibacteria bacterium]